VTHCNAEIILGWSLDGAPAALGLPGLTTTIGPHGYLDLLSQWLGLTATVVPDAVRIGTCLRILRASPDGFWRAALDADSWAVARRVLAMRDALRLGGWNGEMEGAPSRIAELARLGLPCDSVADRLQDVIAELRARPDVRLPALTLLEPDEFWPGLWRILFDVLRAHGVPVQDLALPSATGRGDLVSWQRFVRGEGDATAFQGDASLTLLTGRNETAIGDVISAFLTQDGTGAAVIGAGGGMASALLRARRHPRLTAAEGGDLGAQLLALGLSLLWEPFDAASAIEFLALPNHPLGIATRHLTHAILEMPGHGGPAWHAGQHAALRARLRRDREAGRARDERHRRARDLLAAIDIWVPAQRFDPRSGMPSATALALCARIAAWAQSRAEPEWAAAATQLAKTVEVSGETMLSRRLLKRMLETITTHPIEILPEQAASWRYFTTPSARIDYVETTIWWLESDPAVPARVWRQDERAWIDQTGLRLDDRLCPARDRYGMVRAILACTNRLIVIRSPAGTDTEAAPVATGLLGGCFGSTLDGAWVSAERLQSGGTLAGTRLASENIDASAPPLPRRHWEVSPGLVSPRAEESASGLEKLLGCPLAWTLSYVARLHPRGIAALPDINRLTGLYAHDIVRRVLDEGITSPNLAGNRTAVLFNQSLAERAAPLLQPGLETMRERVRIQLAQAVTKLAASIKEADLTVAAVEESFRRSVKGGESASLTFNGQVDLLLRDGRGRPVVLDAKWSRSGTWYRRRLENGTAVQLAVYSWLVSDGQPATAGYFLLADAQLYAADDSVFEEAAVGGPSMTDIWAGALTDYRQALATLGRGEICATGIDEPGVASDEPARMVPIDPPCGFCDFQTICGKAH
jgi:hypothetical protein